MTRSQQYDLSIEEIAERFDTTDAVDQVLYDLKLLQKSINLAIDQEALKALIEQVEEYIQYDEPFEYILEQIPDKVKSLLV